ncbi:glycerophosphodiester phosphodiesterase [Psychrosphaera haliotis]|uniref:glycerophosphodiester phosphodiesterase n=1 Tax=Psychrosphaera haliotis TaxID=555083 RepID=A0A6N8F7I6_9GAMM|nr:glycerophosphodiester phosphodiesterase [Psychrosphaera haliotis]MUH72526.1 glycerophosphodiester phosphodiesterase [Psychrosphaera haliotis]
MKVVFSVFTVLVLPFLVACSATDGSSLDSKVKPNKTVIAHRGASGYLPEHSMASKAMAYAMKVDYIEQDLVMTKDDHLVVLHDHYLDRVTNVAEKFPSRSRKDGRFYALDFTLAEIKTLDMTEGFSVKEGVIEANYPDRFPIWRSKFKVHTFADEIELIQGLNKSTGQNVGLYPEIKSPAFHLHSGKDISKAVLLELKKYGYINHESKVFVQSFDANELKRIKQALMPQLDMNLKLVQLIAATSWKETVTYKGGVAVPYNYDWMLQPENMDKIAQYADGIGPWKSMLVTENKKLKTVKSNGLVEAAHKAGLLVHPYTFRADKGKVPSYVKDFSELLRFFYFDIGVDGVFTDFPDKAVDVLSSEKQN